MCAQVLAFFRQVVATKRHRTGGKLQRGRDHPIESLSITQEGRDHARIAATMEYGQDKEWFFIWRVNDQKVP